MQLSRLLAAGHAQADPMTQMPWLIAALVLLPCVWFRRLYMRAEQLQAVRERPRSMRSRRAGRWVNAG